MREVGHQFDLVVEDRALEQSVEIQPVENLSSTRNPIRDAGARRTCSTSSLSHDAWRIRSDSSDIRAGPYEIETSSEGGEKLGIKSMLK